MTKAESFKNFVSKHPQLITFIKDKKNTWQDFYEIFDMYGEDEKVWSKYLDDSRALSINELTALMKGVNFNNLQKYINNAQKAINVIQEISTKTPPKVKNIPKTPRPITKFYGD